MGIQVIDSEGYRANVGIILSSEEGQLLWARRIGQDSWQFPQGGIQESETPEDALFRELREEIGLLQEHVEIMGSTEGWLRYQLPENLIRYDSKPVCIGQKQVWFMLRLIAGEECVKLDLNEKPEFDHWRWVDYWHPLSEVVSFKRKVYEQALKGLQPLLFPEGIPRQHRRRRGPRGFMR
jgi:putative (di)nucleoside polyphosphate hydrolase